MVCLTFYLDYGDVGEALGRHNDVDAVSFTGSTEVGGYIYEIFRRK